jgi:hypothetical protein
MALTSEGKNYSDIPRHSESFAVILPSHFVNVDNVLENSSFIFEIIKKNNK